LKNIDSYNVSIANRLELTTRSLVEVCRHLLVVALDDLNVVRVDAYGDEF